MPASLPDGWKALLDPAFRGYDGHHSRFADHTFSLCGPHILALRHDNMMQVLLLELQDGQDDVGKADYDVGNVVAR